MPITMNGKYYCYWHWRLTPYALAAAVFGVWYLAITRVLILEYYETDSLGALSPKHYVELKNVALSAINGDIDVFACVVEPEASEWGHSLERLSQLLFRQCDSSILYKLQKIFSKEDNVQFVNVNIKNARAAGDKPKWRPSQFLYFPKREQDLTCLNAPDLGFYPHEVVAVPYHGNSSLQSMIDFVNEKLGTFYDTTGSVQVSGLYIEQMKRQLYRVKPHLPATQQCGVVHADNLTADEFFMFVSQNKPVVIRDVAKSWVARSKWNKEYFIDQLSDKKVHVKVSPNGIFEGVEPLQVWEQWKSQQVPPAVYSKLESPDTVVVRPAMQDINFGDFLNRLDNRSGSNSSFYIEYLSMAGYMKDLMADIEDPIFADFLKISVKNLWFGDGKTIGKLHFDPFENLMIMINGKKRFVLFDPSQSTYLYEGHIREALLEYNANTDSFSRRKLLESTSMVNSPIDLTHPNLKKYPEFQHARSLECEVGEGDGLYLPAFWWHEVYSKPGVEWKTNIAVNFWFLPFFRKPFPCKQCSIDFNHEVYREELDHFVTKLASL